VNAVFEMFIGQTASVSWFSYFRLGEGFFAERLVDPKNSVKRRATVRTEATSKYWHRTKSGRNRLFWPPIIYSF